MALDFLKQANWPSDTTYPTDTPRDAAALFEAEKALQELAEVFLQQPSVFSNPTFDAALTPEAETNSQGPLLSVEARYRALVEQIPAVVFMAYLDKGIGEA